MRLRLADAVLGASAAVLLAGCAREPAQRPMEFENVSAEVAYTGQQACRQCHLEKFGTYLRTGMGRATYRMAPEEVVEDFTDNNEFVNESSGLHYRMTERDGRFYQAQFRVDANGREFAFAEHELVWVVGSNHHARSYVILRDGKWFQAPVCWYPQESLWEMCPGFEFKNEHFQRELGPDCMSCHNGVMRTVEGERNLYQDPIPHGIGCERCHGPGQVHVDYWRAKKGEAPHGDPDPTIVNPRRLPQQERIEVCFQCHLGDAKATELVLRRGRGWQEFRPGMKVTEIVMPFQFSQRTEHDFGLSAQGDRLVMSRCYKESGGKIECLTCHNPHVTVYDEQRPDDYYRLKCLSCHEEVDCTAADAARRATLPAADDCRQCHMRKAEPDDQRFTEFTDHWIRRDIGIGERDHRRDYALEPIFPERLAELPAAEATYYRARAGFLRARDAPESARPGIWATAEKEFEAAIDRGFDNVDAWFFLGKTRHDMGKPAEALAAFERAVAHDPAHHDAVFALGQALTAKGELPRALELFEGMLARDPEDPMALAERGRVYTLMNRIPEALASYEEAIAVEPWTASLHLNVGMLLASTGRYDEAAERGEAAARLDPDDPEVWEFYAKVMRAAGREDAAAAGQAVLARLRK